jgi:Domain of unknown function (DUF4189)
MRSFWFTQGENAVRGLIVGLLFSSALVWSNPSAADGALAVGLPADVAKQGVALGYSANHATAAEARNAALDQCRTTKLAPEGARALCKIIQEFRNKCVAVAIDPKDGTPGVGWAVASDLNTTKSQAIAKCRDTAGAGRRDACQVNEPTYCDGSAK